MGIITKDIAESFRKNAKVFQAIVDAADVLEQIGSLDNAVKESQDRLAVSRAEESDILVGIEGLKAEIKSLTGKKSEASVRADKLLADAESQAAGIVDAAKVEAERIRVASLDAAEAVTVASEAKALDATIEINSKLAQLEAINADLAAAAKERTAMQKAIDAIKSKFS